MLVVERTVVLFLAWMLVDYWEASELSDRVFDARRTPNLEAIREAAEWLQNVRFV